MTHDEFVKSIVSNTDKSGRVKSRERNDLEYKETFGKNSWAKYAKTMASFANNKGGYILFGIKDNPREIVGVNTAFSNFSQEQFTEYLNSLFSPEILWEAGSVEIKGTTIGYIFVLESSEKPNIALKSECSEKINGGDVYYRYRGRSEKIKYSEMNRLIDERARQERERILKLMEAIRKSDTTNLGIINYNNGRFSTPYGADVIVDKKLIIKVLRKAKYIKNGYFDETKGQPVLKVTGDINLAEEVPVPEIEPDNQYPYLQKNLADRLEISSYQLYSLIWYYKMKGIKKYHLEVSTSASGKVHKFSDFALNFLAEQINANKENKNWLNEIKDKYTKEKYK